MSVPPSGHYNHYLWNSDAIRSMAFLTAFPIVFTLYHDLIKLISSVVRFYEMYLQAFILTLQYRAIIDVKRRFCWASSFAILPVRMMNSSSILQQSSSHKPSAARCSNCIFHIRRIIQSLKQFTSIL